MDHISKFLKPAVHMTVDGKIKHAPPANGTHYTLEELQKLVGGYIQIVTTKMGNIIVVDEEGLVNERAYNEAASKLVGFPVVGDAVYCTADMVR